MENKEKPTLAGASNDELLLEIKKRGLDISLMRARTISPDEWEKKLLARKGGLVLKGKTLPFWSYGRYAYELSFIQGNRYPTKMDDSVLKKMVNQAVEDAYLNGQIQKEGMVLYYDEKFRTRYTFVLEVKLILELWNWSIIDLMPISYYLSSEFNSTLKKEAKKTVSDKPKKKMKMGGM